MAENKTFKATVMVKSSKTNSFMAGSDLWYNLSKKQVESKDAVYQVYEKLQKKDKVSGTYYEFKGKKYIDTLQLDEAAPVETKETEKTLDKPKCEVCGKELKDAKYKKCYECNKKKEEPKEEIKQEAVSEIKKDALTENTYEGRKNTYETPEERRLKQEQIGRGNAVNALTQLLISCKTPEEYKQKLQMLYAEVDKLSEYIQKGR